MKLVFDVSIAGKVVIELPESEAEAVFETVQKEGLPLCPDDLRRYTQDVLLAEINEEASGMDIEVLRVDRSKRA